MACCPQKEQGPSGARQRKQTSCECRCLEREGKPGSSIVAAGCEPSDPPVASPHASMPYVWLDLQDKDALVGAGFLNTGLSRHT